MSSSNNNQSSPTTSPSKHLVVRSSSRTRTPVKRLIPQEDPRRRSDNPSERKRSRDRSQGRSSATRSHKKRITIIETESTTTNEFSPSSTESDYSNEPEITVLPEQAQKQSTTKKHNKQPTAKRSKHTPSFNPDDWKVDTDDSDLDDEYVDAVYKYARHCSDKLAKKKFKDRIDEIN